MFKRPHNRLLSAILDAFDADFLAKIHCYFGGGTAISLALNEYRESVDLDFLCADAEGYRELRSRITQQSLGPLMREPYRLASDVRTERDKISTFIATPELPVKVEIVRESRMAIDGKVAPPLGVPVLSQEDLYASKLLANADRGMDASVHNRDLIDFAMMVRGWGLPPSNSWDKARSAYGPAIDRCYASSLQRLQNRAYLEDCLRKLRMSPDLAPAIVEALESARPLEATRDATPPSTDENKPRPRAKKRAAPRT